MQQQYLFLEVYLSYEQDNGQRGNQENQTTELFKIMPSVFSKAETRTQIRFHPIP